VPDPSWPAPPQGWQFWILDEPVAAAASPWTADRTDGRTAPGAAAPGGSDAPPARPVDVLDHSPDAGPPAAATPEEDEDDEDDDPTAPGRGRRIAIIGAALAAVIGSAGVIGWVNMRGDDPAPTAVTARAGVAGQASASAAATPSDASAGPPVGMPSGPTPTVAGTAATASIPSAPAAAPGTALAALAGLPSRSETGGAPYLRSAFGAGWSDPDRNGCDTGNDVLARDLDAVTRKGTCVVVGGRLLDPYVGRTVTARSVSGVVALDFVVPLADAWVNGANSWTALRRTAFVNDPRNLQAVRTDTAQKKRSRDASGYLPSSIAYRCAYVARQIGVKVTYGLAVGDAERAAIRTVLSTCPSQPLPQDLRAAG
jgi:hypothetical protein